MILIRWRAWWYNKVPLSVLTGLLLLDGRGFTWVAMLALVGLLITVSSMANYGYALNELFDRDEDRHGGRANASEAVGCGPMWGVIALSAGIAMVAATATAGVAGFLITAVELLIASAYSIPPIRLKNKGWLGVVCDAAAAHLYPAMLAIVVIGHQQLRPLTRLLVATAAVWGLMTGLRGILSHQLQNEQHDHKAGLWTVIHRYGHKRVAWFVTFAILPIEIAAFCALVVQCDVKFIFACLAGLFLLYELVKFCLDAFPALVFDRRGGRYLPFVDEGAYKVWGPFALAIDASLADVRYLAVIPLYFVLFRGRILLEWREICGTADMVLNRIRYRKTI
jgi:4-hydroxybenzoate polyprenyltransferase